MTPNCHLSHTDSVPSTNLCLQYNFEDPLELAVYLHPNLLIPSPATAPNPFLPIPNRTLLLQAEFLAWLHWFDLLAIHEFWPRWLREISSSDSHSCSLTECRPKSYMTCLQIPLKVPPSASFSRAATMLPFCFVALTHMLCFNTASILIQTPNVEFTLRVLPARGQQLCQLSPSRQRSPLTSNRVQSPFLANSIPALQLS